jgi:ankyrin repeat protein
LRRAGEFMRRLAGWLCAACCWLVVTAWAHAATPDPTSFGLAVERGDRKTVERWLDEGLDPDYEAAQLGSGLLVAAWHGRIEMMALFVERGADIRRSNRNGEQALQLAAWNGHREAVEWLLAHGAPLDRAGNEWSALHYAVFSGHERIVDDLLGRGANVNARSPNGSTPLMMAAREGREGLARRLLEEVTRKTEARQALIHRPQHFSLLRRIDRLGQTFEEDHHVRQHSPAQVPECFDLSRHDARIPQRP